MTSLGCAYRDPRCPCDEEQGVQENYRYWGWRGWRYNRGFDRGFNRGLNYALNHGYYNYPYIYEYFSSTNKSYVFATAVILIVLCILMGMKIFASRK